MKLTLVAALVPILCALTSGCDPAVDPDDPYEEVGTGTEAIQISFFSTLQSRVGANLCMAVTPVMSGVQMATCVTEPSQQWRFFEDGTIRSALRGDLCLTANEGFPGAVVFEPCGDLSGQRWSISPDASVRNEISTYACLGATGVAPGSAVIIDVCDHEAHQEWVKRDIREPLLENLRPRHAPHIDPNPELDPGHVSSIR